MLDPSNPQVTLDEVEREVRRRYPVADVTAGTLAGMLAAGPVTLFDVRTREEFDAGHLPGAIRIEPGASAQDILREHRDKLGEQAIVFYCAVGVRSSRMLMRTLRDLTPQTPGRLYNLRGGVFRWAAHGGTLVRGGEAGEPHPFDEDWGSLLSRTLSGS
jgi:rhodanese-related sulfurtransferase